MKTIYYKNIFVNNTEKKEKYKSKRRGSSSSIPERERVLHGNLIQNKLKEIWEQEKRKAVSISNRKGTYIEFQSAPDFELASKSLESKNKGIKLLNIRVEEDNEGKKVNKATVFVPKGEENYFLKRAKDYTDGIIKKNSKKPANTPLIASIEDLRVAVLDSFWIGKKSWMPKDNLVWCEIWLSTSSLREENEFRELAEKLGIEVKKDKLDFPERTVLFSKVNRIKLEELVENSPYIAEIRRATEPANFFTELENSEQSDWVEDLISRRVIESEKDIYVSILDTGVNNGHELIKDNLEDEDCHCYKDEWGSYDHEGHGTKMAGVCLFGGLEDSLTENTEIRLTHNLESFKILPPIGENEPELYGAITSQSVSRLTIKNPTRKRVLCMAVTAPKYDTGDGSPTSWSATIDEITSGSIDGKKKLFIISAGNMDNQDDLRNYHTSNEVFSVQNPGQAWNSITVGAYTDKYSRDSVAKKGGLSPYSSTSNLWDSKWPIKPEILLEGGNLLKDGNYCFNTEELSVLTTSHNIPGEQFTTICGTSSASAQAAWMAAKLKNSYPTAWPETIRGLMIHSATWTEEMKNQFLDSQKKTDYRKLLRSCGYGVPSLNRAIRCKNNSVNLIIESELQPFEKGKNGIKTKDMNLHKIPWPKEVLEGLFDAKVEMKVTLSYFIEPGPGEVGWKNKYKYSSCGLRFDVNGSEDENSFLGRISSAIENDEENISSGGSGADWVLGPNNRNSGSIHSDIWVGNGAQLSTSNMICVYPVNGWWKERKHLERWNKKIRYSLIISLSTSKQKVNLYTPIVSQIRSEQKVKIKTSV